MRQKVRVRLGQRFTPSFSRHVEEEIRILKLVANSTSTDPFSLWRFMAKGSGVRELVEGLSLAAPKVLFGPMPSADVPWDDLPSSFVVKPSTGSSSRGVCIMRRSDDGGFDDLIGGQRWTVAEIVRHYQQLPSTWHDVLRDEVLVEQLVECGGRPTYDWKVFAFRGEIALISQINRLSHPKSCRYYLPDWSPARHVYYGRYDRADPLPAPTRPDELLRTAAELSLALPIPFVRADLYESDAEVVVGELTPFPGLRHEFSPTWDRILGEAWERGEAALRIAHLPRYRLPLQAGATSFDERAGA